MGLTYLELLDALRFVNTHKMVRINLNNQESPKESSEYQDTKMAYIQKMKQICLNALLLMTIVIFADFPIGFDHNSIFYLLGFFTQGILVPSWFMLAYPDCYNFVLRDLFRRWPLSCFLRLQRGHSSRA